ncbi:MAG TPA: DMT family transporter [Gaiellaceae bacterium]|nr:DMT family transporter [Gaiellaceae bacterium]
MGDEARAIRRRGQTYAVGAALAWSTAGVLQRGLSVDAATQVAGRAFFAVLALLAFVRYSKHGGGLRAFRSLGRAEWAVAVTTGIASSMFIVALNHTSVANVLFMQAVAPIAAALISWVALREPISRRTGVSMVVALAGVGLMVGGPGGAQGVGLVLSVLMTLSFAVTVVITRHRRDISMAPAICLSQVLVLVVFAPFSSPGQIDKKDLALIALLGVTQIGLGLAFLTMAARLIPAAEVALISLLEVVLGPLWVWLAFSESPSTATLAGGVVVIAAVVLQAAPAGRGYQPRRSSSSDGSSDEVEMPTIASPSPADTSASTLASR